MTEALRILTDDKPDELEFHPLLAEVRHVVSTQDEHFVRLRESIRNVGQLHAILLYDGMILDGRRRYLACRGLGIDPFFKEYVGDEPLKALVAVHSWKNHTVTDSVRIGEAIAEAFASSSAKSPECGNRDH